MNYNNFRDLIISLWLPIILVSIFFFVFNFGDHIPLLLARFLYSASLTIKGLILLILPIMVIIFIANSLVNLQTKVINFSIFLIIFIFLSNFLSVIYGFTFFENFNLNLREDSIGIIKDSSVTKAILKPLWILPNINLINNELAIVIGFLLGIILSLKPIETNKQILARYQHYCHVILKKIVIPVLPIFILGFALKMQFEKIIDHSSFLYGKVFLMFTISQALYVLITFIIAAEFKLNKFIIFFKNILPVTMTGLSTFSSAATLPITLHAAEKNLKDKRIAHSFIPATSNIHMVGTAIGMNIIILSSFEVFNVTFPTFEQYVIFAFYFAMAQFAVVGVPGGSIFVLAPIIESHLNATPEMISLITALVLLFDPVDTAFNVTSNSIFAIIFEKIYKHRFLKFIHG